MYLKMRITDSTEDYLEEIQRIRILLEETDAIVIGAGAGLSTSAGLEYSGERFTKNFSDFIGKYGYGDMYTAAFGEYEDLEEHWAYWSRHIYHNRYYPELNDTYKTLFDLVKNKNYFVLTTNADHLFLKNGFDKKRVFYTQGDYGLWQCSKPCHYETYDNEDMVMKMVSGQKNMKIPSELIPYCPKCGAPMTMNLRCDGTFVQDKGWDEAAARYEKFIEVNQNKKVVFLELGVGANTPGIIKYPFWQMTYHNPQATYLTVNMDDWNVPQEIMERAISVVGDVGMFLKGIKI